MAALQVATGSGHTQTEPLVLSGLPLLTIPLEL